MSSADRPEGLQTAPVSGPASADQTPSATRPVRAPEPAPSSDTLLSVPAPSTREDLFLDERVTASEQKLADMESRIERLERRPVAGTETSPSSWWVWLLFLAGLAVAWQIVEHFR